MHDVTIDMRKGGAGVHSKENNKDVLGIPFAE
jgi:hypothetical protein